MWKKAKFHGWLASAILFITALFHGSGYPSVMREIQASNLDADFGRVVGVLWLFASVQWITMAIIALYASYHEGRVAKIVLLGISLLIIIDACLIYWAVGPFLGELMLVISATFYVMSVRRFKA